MKPKNLNIDPKKETEKIKKFIKITLKNEGFKKIVIALSGGVDSTTSLFLLTKALRAENIFVVHLPHQETDNEKIKIILEKAKIPKNNFSNISIKKTVDEFIKLLKPNKNTDQIRKGNIIARTRMIILYDLAKKHNAIVCGTENKSEKYLGYFTRFGDEASDIEPIQHLYKTQVFQLASYLGVPKEIIEQQPTAGLWTRQTDEKEFGFTYQEADKVLYYYFDRRLTIKDIKEKGFKNTEKILYFVCKNQFKHHTPYFL